MEARAHVPTAHASRYMVQLAKHWSHKFEVTYDERQATFPLPAGTARMTAEADALDIVLEADNAEALLRLREVVASHVKRFAFREPELAFDWQ